MTVVSLVPMVAAVTVLIILSGQSFAGHAEMSSDLLTLESAEGKSLERLSASYPRWQKC